MNQTVNFLKELVVLPYQLAMFQRCARLFNRCINSYVGYEPTRTAKGLVVVQYLSNGLKRRTKNEIHSQLCCHGRR